MKQTIKLYDDHPYETEFTAEIVSAEQKKKGLEVVLDQTLFFPEEGGQSPDTGKLGGFDVADVQIREGVITHLLKCKEKDAASLQPGMQVQGTIDWDHRFSNMQNHTGEHILSGLIHSTFRYDNVGFHLSDREVTLDVNGLITEEQLRDLERRANEAVYRNIGVIAEYPDREILKDLDYRSKIEIDGPVRIVTIPGVDVCACCAPHVAHTGEIGILKIVHSMKYKGGMRLNILCGRRAVRYLQNLQQQMWDLSHILSAKQEQVVPYVEKQMADMAAMKEKLTAVQKKTAEAMADQVPAETPVCWLFENELDNPVQRNLVNTLVEKGVGIAGVFHGEDAQGYRYIIGSRTRDSREAGNVLREKCNARGGGKPEMIQGSVSASEAEIREALKDM